MFNFGNHNKLYLGQTVNSGNLNSFYFDGVNSSFNAASSASYNYATTFDFTVAFTAKVGNIAAGQSGLVAKIVSSAGWSCTQIAQTLRLSYSTDGSNTVSLTTGNLFTSTSIVGRVMMRISSVKANCAIYWNGINQNLTDTSVGTVTNITTAAFFSLGSRNNTGEFFNGYLDEVCFWDSNQSDLAVADYNNGIPFNRLLLPTPPEHYYKGELDSNDSGTGAVINLSSSGAATYAGSITN